MDHPSEDGDSLSAQVLRAAAELLEDSRRGGGNPQLRARLRELKARLAAAKGGPTSSDAPAAGHQPPGDAAA
jgi:hypothetical protein